jgi:hypothetical protein
MSDFAAALSQKIKPEHRLIVVLVIASLISVWWLFLVVALMASIWFTNTRIAGTSAAVWCALCLAQDATAGFRMSARLASVFHLSYGIVVYSFLFIVIFSLSWWAAWLGASSIRLAPKLSELAGLAASKRAGSQAV